MPQIAMPEGTRMTTSDRALTFGVEEEFLLVDPRTGRVVGLAPEVLAHVPAYLRPYVKPELHTTMVEISTPVLDDLETARAWLLDARRALSGIAKRVGVLLIAAGNAVRPCPTPPKLTPDPRFEKMRQRFGPLVEVQGLCACHVHVGIDDPELAIEACNRIRPWLPILHALTANSPFANDSDTGYASWRSILWNRWPSVGPSPVLRSMEHYEQVADGLLAAGAIVDRRMIYWYARPSTRYPTLEVRAGDTCATVAESLLLAALSRALVATILDEIAAGAPALEVDDRILELAHWRAAHQGVDGTGLDPLTGQVSSGWRLTERLFTWVRPALEARGDLAMVTETMNTLRAKGCGATRQRAVFARRHEPMDVVHYLAQQTIEG